MQRKVTLFSPKIWVLKVRPYRRTIGSTASTVFSLVSTMVGGHTRVTQLHGYPSFPSLSRPKIRSKLPGHLPSTTGTRTAPKERISLSSTKCRYLARSHNRTGPAENAATMQVQWDKLRQFAAR